MNQYYQILSSCRVPGPKQDLVTKFSRTKKPPMHITVVHNYQFFELDVYHSDGTPLTSDQIFMQLEKVWNSSLQTNKEPVGILTSNHRNSWAKAYSTLIKDKVNRESVHSIQRSIFTVCLDAPMPRVSEDTYRSQVAGQMLHGGGSKLNSGNRWFDKTLQFIVAEDGACGLIYEHAAAEGPPSSPSWTTSSSSRRGQNSCGLPWFPCPCPRSCGSTSRLRSRVTLRRPSRTSAS